MESSNLVKVTAAFVSGVVVALGSALIVAHVSDVRRPVPVTPAADVSALPAELPTTGGDAGAQQRLPAPADTGSDLEPSAPTQVKIPVPARRVVERRRPELVVARVKSSAKPVILAQAEVPPPVPVSAPLPAPSEAPSAAQSAPPVVPESVADSKNTVDAPSPSQAPPPAAPQPHTVTLPVGTVVAIRIGETLSTDHNYTGDTFRATLMSPIIMDGFIIADRGSKVLGKIVNAQSAGHLSNAAGLTLAVTEINTTDGQRVRIETNVYELHGPSSTGQEMAKVAGGAALGAIIGGAAGGGKGAAIGAGLGGAAGTGAVLLTRGKPAVIQSETPLTFRLANPVTITEKLN